MKNAMQIADGVFPVVAKREQGQLVFSTLDLGAGKTQEVVHCVRCGSAGTCSDCRAGFIAHIRTAYRGTNALVAGL